MPLSNTELSLDEDAAIANLLAAAQQAVVVADGPLATEAAAEVPMITAAPPQAMH